MNLKIFGGFKVFPKKLYRWICVILGFVGVMDVAIVGLYLVVTSLSLSFLPGSERFLSYAYTAAILTVVSIFLLVYGSCSMWRGRLRIGGALNFFSGIIFISFYLYFSFFSQPSLLGWFWPFGCFLFLPLIFSGVMGMLVRDVEGAS
jgi:hypothetical protein